MDAAIDFFNTASAGTMKPTSPTRPKVEIIATDTIKPSSPTPEHLRNFDLSLFDLIMPASFYTSLVLLYPSGGSRSENAESSQKLKASLSETLTHFYPLAGRFKDDVTIDCNDEGVRFLEAQANCLLSDVLKHPDPEFIQKLCPAKIASTEASAGYILHVLVTFFECGGTVISLSISHRIADASTLSMFIKGWSAAAAARGSGEEETVLPELFSIASRFPALPVKSPPAMKLEVSKCITRRYVFDATKIDALRAEAASASVQKPTRVETVCAFIWKCAINALRSKSGRARSSFATHLVDLRKRVEPPLPQNSFGNFLSHYKTGTEEGTEVELQRLVSELRSKFEAFIENDVKNKLKGSVEALSMIYEAGSKYVALLHRDDVDLFTFTSWCRFSFYDADFGWGKPAWVSNADWGRKNTVILMDTVNGDGIEVWVTMPEEHIALLEEDKDLLAFASFNPKVLP